MARFARVIALGVPHHITQRGNARRFILDSDADRRVYLDLLRQSAERSEIELIGYLISNHVHLIAIPNKANVLGLALKDAHGGMLPTGTRCVAVAVTFGRAGIIHALWMSPTSGRRCAIRS